MLVPHEDSCRKDLDMQQARDTLDGILFCTSDTANRQSQIRFLSFNIKFKQQSMLILFDLLQKTCFEKASFFQSCVQCCVFYKSTLIEFFVADRAQNRT